MSHMSESLGSADRTHDQRTPGTVWRRLVVLAGFGALMTAGLLFPFPVHGREWNELFNLAHAPAFFALTLVIAGFVDPVAIGLTDRFQTLFRIDGLRAGVICLSAIVLGAAAEWLQQSFGRSASWGDIVANSAGAVAGFVWLAVARTERLRRAGRAAALLLLCCASWRPVAELRDWWQQRQEFPVLSSFERSRELSIWRAINASIGRSDQWATDGEHSLRISLRTAEFSGAALEWPMPDWRGYETLQMDLHNVNAEPLVLTLKISDRDHSDSDFAPDDRFERLLFLPPGEELHVVIALSEVVTAPRARNLDLAEVNQLELFVSDCRSVSEFMIDNLRLRRN
jgi:VanZ family protein